METGGRRTYRLAFLLAVALAVGAVAVYIRTRPGPPSTVPDARAAPPSARRPSDGEGTRGSAVDRRRTTTAVPREAPGPLVGRAVDGATGDPLPGGMAVAVPEAAAAPRRRSEAGRDPGRFSFAALRGVAALGDMPLQPRAGFAVREDMGPAGPGIGGGVRQGRLCGESRGPGLFGRRGRSAGRRAARCGLRLPG